MAEIRPLRLAVLLSGSGRTLENFARLIDLGELRARVALVIASRPGIGAIARCERLKLPCVVVDRRSFVTPSEFSDVVWRHIREAKPDLVTLAGWLWLLPIAADFAGRVVNIHPALLPSFGGQGMFGHHVHEAVLRAGCKVTGCTVHFCDNHYDRGPILVQRTCEVRDDDTPDTLADRVFEQECLAYPQAINLLAQRWAKPPHGDAPGR